MSFNKCCPLLSYVVLCCLIFFFASQINFSSFFQCFSTFSLFLILFLKRSGFLLLFILMPFQGDCYSRTIPRALPRAKCSLALQAVAKQRDASMRRLYFVTQGSQRKRGTIHNSHILLIKNKESAIIVGKKNAFYANSLFFCIFAKLMIFALKRPSRNHELP